MQTQAATFYRRPLPAPHIPFASEEGRQLFREALDAGGMEGYFALAEQFQTQAEPAFCGLATLVVVLNALEIDPGRIWKGPWRWFGEELLDCCLPLEQVKARGVTLDEVACLARCNGATADTVRADEAGVDALRAVIRQTTAATRGPVLVASYSRAALGQTGDGHFSPIAGYHAARDLALILDVARFKYPPHWVSVEALWAAMSEPDPATGRARGWIRLGRAPLRTLPMYFRMSAGDGLGPLVSTLLQELPALLGGISVEAPESLLPAWLHAAEGRLGDRLCQCFGPHGAVLSRLPAEHRETVSHLLDELRDTAIHRAIVAARTPGDAPLVADDVWATLLLALPEDSIAGLPPLARQTLDSLRSRSILGPGIAEEIAALREQIGHLSQWDRAATCRT